MNRLPHLLSAAKFAALNRRVVLMIRQITPVAVVAVFTLLASIWPGHAAGEEGVEEIKRSGKALLPYFAEQPADTLGDHFGSEFLKVVPIKKLGEVFQAVHKQCGKAESVQVRKMTGPYAADIEFLFPMGFRATASLTVQVKAPHKITSLVFRHVTRTDDSLAGVTAEFKALPGQPAFMLMRLGKRPEVIAQFNGEKPLAVASSFKLVVLAALAEEIAAGKRAWSDVVPLRKQCRSLSSGLLQDWPDGSPLTLHTLASLMISKSDNTAADHLIHVLGRERLEGMQKTLGVRDPPRNQPFLSTVEMFKIKLVMNTEQQEKYASADPAGRRQLLETLVKETPLEKPRLPGEPMLIDQVEWWFSAGDLCRIMNWLRAQGPEVRQMLAINNALLIDTEVWSYVGYKAGAEAGVLSFVFLLRNAAGDWFACATIWNQSDRDVDETAFTDLTQRLVRALQKPLPK